MQAQSCADWGSNPGSATYRLCDLGLSESCSAPVQNGNENSTYLMGTVGRIESFFSSPQLLMPGPVLGGVEDTLATK